MKNKEMYVITMSTGSYDSYNLNIVAVTDDFSKGESYVNKMNQVFLTMDKKLSDFHRDEYAAWQVANPRPEVEIKKLFSVPQWTGNKEITKEMLEEKEILECKNAEIIRQAYEPVERWWKDLMSYTETWAKTNFTQEELDIYLIRDENHWHIEKAKWL